MMWESRVGVSRQIRDDATECRVHPFENSGAQGRIRTDTLSPAGDFESPASTIPPLGPRCIA